MRWRRSWQMNGKWSIVPDDDPASALLAECRATLEAASPLPWELHVTGPGTPHEMTDIWRGDDEEYVAQDVIPADGCFIVTARTAMRGLLAGYEALLKLADDWDATARMIGGQVALEDCDGATAGFKMIGYQNHRDHAEALREAIRAALAGKEG